MTKCSIELDKNVFLNFCFIKLFQGVAAKLEFYLPYLCWEDFCLPSSQSKHIIHFKLVYWWNIYSSSRKAIWANSLNEMLLSKFFITKVQYDHTCSNIISRIYSRSEEHLFWSTFTSSSFWTWQKLPNYSIIPSNFHAIFFRTVIACENQ